jgi:Xaa-Pro aminopeptidase/Xaa-Pro dipeptidase
MSTHSGKHQLDGRERIARIQDALKFANLDAILCTLPSNVLMLSGYWPVIGTGMAVATTDGVVAVLAPQDELPFAEHGWAHRVDTFTAGSLEKIRTPALAASDPLRKLIHDLKLECARIGYELGEASEPASYASMHVYNSAIIDMLRQAAPSAALAPANQIIDKLAATKTQPEVARIRTACRIAYEAYAHGRTQLDDCRPESEIASAYRAGFSVFGMAQSNVLRADGFAWCMSGPNSARAGAPFAYTGNRRIERGDMVLIHSNSYADGYWTDITRTQVIGERSEKQTRIFVAIEEARNAALVAIRPGARAADVDAVARNVLRRHGFEKEFSHGLGHGVGFAAISANAHPQIHPKSDEVLETGMTFNIEPAVYIESFGGARHCDVVAVIGTGMELLTDFQSELS